MRRYLILILIAVASHAEADELDGAFEMSFEATMKVSGDDPHADGLSLSGRLDRTEAGLVLSDLDCSQPPGPRGSALCEDLSGVLSWKLTQPGALERVHLRDDLSVAAETLLKGIASLVQFVPAEGETWQTTEIDTMGTYLAEYRRAGNRIDRMKTEYLQVADQSGLRPPQAGELEVDSRTTAEFRDGRLVRLSVEEKIRRAGGGLDLPDAVVTTRLGLVRIDAEPRSAHESPLDDGWVRPYDPIRPDTVRRAIDEGKIAGRDYDALMVQAVSAEGQLHATTSARRALIALPALMRQSAEGRAVDAQRCAVVIASLGMAGDPASQHSLREIFTRLARAGRDTEERAKLRREVVRALGTRSGGPLSEETRIFLISLMSDPTVGSQAAYGLGAEAYRRRSAGDPTSALFAQPLLAALDDGASAIVMNAIGNAGSPEAIPNLRQVLKRGDGADAAIAVTALRRMPTVDAVDQMLLNALDDPREVVRQAALAVAGTRPSSPELRSQLQDIAGARGGLAEMARPILDRWNETSEADQ
jgi:hypothetical protein